MFYFKWINSMACKRHHPFTFHSKMGLLQNKGKKAYFSQILKIMYASPSSSLCWRWPPSRAGEEEVAFWVGSWAGGRGGATTGWRCSAEHWGGNCPGYSRGGRAGCHGRFFGQPHPVAQRVLPPGQVPKTRPLIRSLSVFDVGSCFWDLLCDCWGSEPPNRVLGITPRWPCLFPWRAEGHQMAHLGQLIYTLLKYFLFY